MFEQIVQILNQNGIVVIRTDTIYGIVARAASQPAVEKIYHIKQRASDKPCIVLLAEPNSVAAHSDLIESYTKASKSPTSIIVPVSDEPNWITRGGDSVAYRVVPYGTLLHDIIMAVGPLVAPSANPESQPPARNIKEAENYFGKQVDLYVDDGEVPDSAHASEIIRIHDNGEIEKIR